MIASKVSRHVGRAAVAVLVLAPMFGAALVLPSSAEEAAKCTGTLLECLALEAKEGAARLSAPPTSPPVVGETLASTSD